MRIHRDFGNGTEIIIELTQTELREAYYEQQYNFDVADILLHIEDMEADGEIEVMIDPEGNEDLARELAPRYRGLIDDNKDAIEFEWETRRRLIKGEL